LQDIGTCPSCRQEVVGDTSKARCPYCDKPYPPLRLLVNGSTISLTEASILVGRGNLGGSEVLSAEHAILYRKGPVYRIEDRSSNGTYRRANGAWVRLPTRQPIRVREGDILSFANVEARVVQA
jgi:hypothetical protein